MKTLITYTFITFAGLISIFLIPKNKTYSQPIEIIYGRGSACYGKGICDIIYPEESTSNSVQLLLDEEGLPLFIDIPKSSLNKEETLLQFSDRFIRIDKNILISQGRSSNENKVEIEPGIYPVTSDEFTYRVRVTTSY